MKKLSDYFERVLYYVDADLAEKYKNGIIISFIEYVKNVSHDIIQIENDMIYVPDNLITEKFLNEYFKKRKNDISAKDCAYMALERIGFPL